MKLKDRFDRLPGAVQQWIRIKYAKEGKRPFRGSDIVSINTTKMKELQAVNEKKDQALRWEAAKLDPESSPIVDINGNPIRGNNTLGI